MGFGSHWTLKSTLISCQKLLLKSHASPEKFSSCFPAEKIEFNPCGTFSLPFWKDCCITVLSISTAHLQQQHCKCAVLINGTVKQQGLNFIPHNAGIKTLKSLVKMMKRWGFAWILNFFYAFHLALCMKIHGRIKVVHVRGASAASLMIQYGSWASQMCCRTQNVSTYYFSDGLMSWLSVRHGSLVFSILHRKENNNVLVHWHENKTMDYTDSAVQE